MVVQNKKLRPIFGILLMEQQITDRESIIFMSVKIYAIEELTMFCSPFSGYSKHPRKKAMR